MLVRDSMLLLISATTCGVNVTLLLHLPDGTPKLVTIALMIAIAISAFLTAECLTWGDDG